MGNFNQHDIIAKINQYLTLRHRDLRLTSGYCHGIALLWLYKMSAGQEQWFYTLVQQLAGCHSEQQFEEIEWDLELFIAYIEWLQNSSVYLPGVNQSDIDKLVEFPKGIALSFLFHHSQLDSLLLKLLKNNKLVTISGPDHTICIYKNGDDTYLFDPEFNQLQPKVINDSKLLKAEIIKCLYKRAYLPACRLPMQIVAFAETGTSHAAIASDEFATLHARLVKECDDINKPGLDGMTHLHLACESGNEVEVRNLLEAGAQPNQFGRDDWTPMLVASARGYTPIVNLLMRFGALRDMPNKRGIKPADLAKEAGHEEIVRILMR